MLARIISYANSTSIRKKNQSDRYVLVGGCFDIFHYGHFIFLMKAKESGTHLIVALESDIFIQSHKKKQPIHTQYQRAEILASLRFIDTIVCLEGILVQNDYLELVKTINPDIIAVTSGDPHLENKQKQAATIGADVLEVTSLLEGFSSSRIRTV